MTATPIAAVSKPGRFSLWASRKTVLAFAPPLAALLGTVAGSGSLSTMPAGAAQLSCDTSVPAFVRYVAAPDLSGSVVVRSIIVSGLPAGCGGEPVAVDFYGNSAGDPTVPLAQDKLLAEADSTLDACTQQALVTPGLVTSGGLTVSLCPSGGPAGVVSVHDLIAVSLRVAGAPVAIAGQSFRNTSQKSAIPASQGSESRGELAFTGAQIAFAAFAGIFGLVAGTLLVLGSVRLQRKRGRRSPA